MSRAQIELDFIREFAHSGLQLGPMVSSEERRERIRRSILREQKESLRFRDTELTYAQVYRLAYNKSIEVAKVQATAAIAAVAEPFPEDEVDEELESTSELIG